MLYDPARTDFALSDYLVPSADARWGSAVASLGLDWRSHEGDFRFHLAADTGEARLRRDHTVVDVCLSGGQNGSPTGLANPGERYCLVPALHTIVPVPSVAETGSRLTLDGRPATDELRDTWLLREVYGTVALGRAGFARFTVGRRRTLVGGGLVHDDAAAVGAVDLDLGAIGPPFGLSAKALVPDRTWPTAGSTASPMFAASADWQVSLFERVGVFGAYLRDRSNAVAEALRGEAIERRVADHDAATDAATREVAARQLARALAREVTSAARLWWVGTTGDLAPLPGHRLTWTLAALEGTIDSVDVPRLRLVEAAPVHGRAARAGWDVDLPAGFSAGASFVWLSGGQLSLEKGASYDGFLGVVPYVPHTNLFFKAGLANTFVAREATAPGVNGRGVLSPALRVSWDPTDELGFDVKGAWLRADRTGPFGGKVYGWEVDAQGAWQALPWLALQVEGDVLLPGDFYGGQDTVYRAILAVDVVTP
ncbi:MAG: hypothetical protein QM704_03480 [Anaeromyxobacteraceae bacterium]